MNPAELLLTGSVFLGMAVPMTAVIEMGRAPADMDRYVLSHSCPEVEVCMIDTKTNRVMGSRGEE